MLTVSWFVCGILYFFLYSYLFSELVCKEKFKFRKCHFLGSIGIFLLGYVIEKMNCGYLRPYIIHLYLFMSLLIMNKKSFVQTLLGTLFIMIIVCACEMICGLILILVFKIDVTQAVSTFWGYLLLNILILISTILIAKIKFVQKIIMNIINWYNENERKSLILFSILALTIATFLLYINLINLFPTKLLGLVNLFCVGVLVFVIGFFREKTNNNKIIYEYDQLMDYVKTYEVLLDEKSKKQHEYRNQLAVIRIMAKNKRTREYIYELLDEENTENNLETINKLKYIPTGGLKGLIYYKIETMKKKSINIFVDVSSELDNHKLWKECDKNLQDISKVLGVYLDNAIEAAELSKEKYITFEAYLDEKSIVFKISNTYENKIDVGKIDKEGYSTKGKGKGYGLALVKDIISKNNSLTQKREMNGIYYVQILYIKK